MLKEKRKKNTKTTHHQVEISTENCHSGIDSDILLRKGSVIQNQGEDLHLFSWNMICLKTLLECEDAISNHTWYPFFFTLGLCPTFVKQGKGKQGQVSSFSTRLNLQLKFGDLVFALVYSHIQNKGKKGQLFESIHLKTFCEA